MDYRTVFVVLFDALWVIYQDARSGFKRLFAPNQEKTLGQSGLSC